MLVATNRSGQVKPSNGSPASLRTVERAPSVPITQSASNIDLAVLGVDRDADLAVGLGERLDRVVPQHLGARQLREVAHDQLGEDVLAEVQVVVELLPRLERVAHVRAT